MAEHKKKTYVGEVVSDRMDKTVVVAIPRRIHHPLYNKIVSRVSKLKAHDEKNECKVGDKVTIIETRPLSKEKRFLVVGITEKAK